MDAPTPAAVRRLEQAATGQEGDGVGAASIVCPTKPSVRRFRRLCGITELVALTGRQGYVLEELVEIMEDVG